MAPIARLLILALLLPLFGACSMGQMIARSSVSIMDGGVEAMNRETDLVLAASAIPANLKLVEGLIEEDPDNAALLANAAQGFYGYAFGFTELEDPARALALYRRCAGYGTRALRSFGFDVDPATAGMEEIDAAAAALNRKAVPALFWTASCLAKQIDLNRTDPAQLARLAGTERLMNRVMELQPDYYYGGPHLYYGVYYGGRAPMFGGDHARAETSFASARAATGGKLLMVDVLQAEYLERQRLDQARFSELLQGVIDAPRHSFPEMALANEIARVRARHLLQQETEWF